MATRVEEERVSRGLSRLNPRGRAQRFQIVGIFFPREVDNVRTAALRAGLLHTAVVIHTNIVTTSFRVRDNM